MIRVLHSELQDKIGGIESFLRNMAAHIDSGAFQFDFLIRGENPALEKYLAGCGSNIHRVPTGFFAYCVMIRKLLKSGRYDIIHIHKNSAANISLPLLVRLFCKSRVIVHSHNTQPAKSHRALQLLHAINRPLLFRLADTRLACSAVAGRWLFGERPFNCGQVQVVRNAIDTDRFGFDPKRRGAVRAGLALEDKLVVGHVGRFSPQKNHRFLLAFFRILCNKQDNAVLLLLGGQNTGGEALENSIRAQAQKLGLRNKVLFLGSYEDISGFYQAMDVFVLPSIYEGLAMVAIEAQCAGLGCVLSDRIADEAKILKSVRTLSLGAPKEEWADAVAAAAMQNNRLDCRAQVAAAGFDSKAEVSHLEDIYRRTLQNARRHQPRL